MIDVKEQVNGEDFSVRVNGHGAVNAMYVDDLGNNKGWKTNSNNIILRIVKNDENYLHVNITWNA